MSFCCHSATILHCCNSLWAFSESPRGSPGQGPFRLCLSSLPPGPGRGGEGLEQSKGRAAGTGSLGVVAWGFPQLGPGPCGPVSAAGLTFTSPTCLWI